MNLRELLTSILNSQQKNLNYAKTTEMGGFSLLRVFCMFKQKLLNITVNENVAILDLIGL